MAQAIIQDTTQTYLSTLNITKPQKRNVLFQRYGVDQGLVDVLRSFGLEEKRHNVEYSHFEEGWLHEAIRIKENVGSPGAGNDLVFKLHADSIDANNKYYVQLNDTLMLATNQVVGKVTAIDVTTPSDPVITLTPNSSTANFGAVLAGDYFSVISNSWAEGTAQPNSYVSIEDEYTFYLQIIKGTAEATGTALNIRNWYETASISGKNVAHKFYQTEMEEDIRVKLRIDQAFLFNTPTTGSNVDSRNMQGLFPWVRSRGNSSTVEPGMFSMVKFDVMKNTLDRQQAPNEMFGYLGSHLYTDVENTILDFVDPRVMFTGGQGTTPEDIGINFKTFMKGGRRYHLTEARILNHSQIHGIPGSNLPSTGVWLPFALKKDPRTGRRIPQACFTYLQDGKEESRMMQIWETGGASARKTDQIDKKQVNYRCEVGSEFFGANQFYLTEPSGAS